MPLLYLDPQHVLQIRLPDGGLDLLVELQDLLLLPSLQLINLQNLMFLFQRLGS